MGRDNAYLENMAHATAQEEAAVVCTAPSAIAAKYLLPKQNLVKELGLNLSDDGHINIDHNYHNLVITDEKSFIKKVGVGIQKNASVTSGEIIEGNGPTALHKKCTDSNQKVNQIFVSAFDIAPYGGQWLTCPYNQFKTMMDTKKSFLARLFIKAAYEGTIKAATTVSTSNKELFLTMMGSGVFKNKTSWITDALYDDELIDFIRSSNLTINFIYRPDKELRSAQDDIPFVQAMVKLVQKINNFTSTDEKMQNEIIAEYVTKLYNNESCNFSELQEKLAKLAYNA